MRTEQYLRQTCQYQYAFVGLGQHSLTNLYPVLHYLGVPLKYVCVTSERKARLIERKFVGLKATTSLDTVLNDETVRGVFVSTSPSAHFSLASQILKSGKSLFIEKPPCRTLAELDALIDLQRTYGSPVAMTGLQKRYAPAIQLLKKRLAKEQAVNYDLHYLTGVYPEGDALTDLFVHPLDLVCHLFGQPEILAVRQVAADALVLMLQHPHTVGTLELSTAYAWTAAEETLKVCTTSGIYRLSQMDELTYEPRPAIVCGIPTDKIRSRRRSIDCLWQRNGFTPTLANNQVYSQGYFDEIKTFVDAVEGRAKTVPANLQAIKDTYQLINKLQTHKNK